MLFAPRRLVYRFMRRLALAGIGLWMAAGAAAQSVAPSGDAAPVLTRARIASFLNEADGKAYVRLKLLPRSKLPFTVQTFRVADRALLAGLSEGTWVNFAAKHVDGENTVTSIQAVAECRRFQPCD